MNFDKIFSAPPTQLCMPYFYKSIKNSCQKSRIDYDRLFQSAVRNGDDYEQFIIDVNDEVNKNIAWILKVCSGGNHDAELELLNLNNGLDSIYSLMHNKQFVYKCNSNSTMEFLMNGMHEQDDAGYDFMQFFDDFEDSFYNFRLNNGYAGIYVHAIKTRYTFSSHKGDNLPAIAFSILTLPPSYEHLQRCTSKVFRSDRSCEHFNVHVRNIQFIDDYCIQILSDSEAETFSLEDYIFSDSKWYNLLQDKEYFKQGKLVMIGEPCCINQCIIWPDKQFVRIIELYKDKYPQKSYEIEYAEVSNKMYERWVDYRSSSGIRYSDYDEKDYYYYQCKKDKTKYKHSISVNGKLWQFDSVKELAQKLDKAPSTIYYYLKRGLNYKDIIEKVTMSFKAVTVAGIDYVFCSDSDLSTRLGKSSSYVNVYRRAGLSYEEIIVKALHLKG